MHERWLRGSREVLGRQCCVSRITGSSLLYSVGEVDFVCQQLALCENQRDNWGLRRSADRLEANPAKMTCGTIWTACLQGTDHELTVWASSRSTFIPGTSVIILEIYVWTALSTSIVAAWALSASDTAVQ